MGAGGSYRGWESCNKTMRPRHITRGLSHFRFRKQFSVPTRALPLRSPILNLLILRTSQVEISVSKNRMMARDMATSRAARAQQFQRRRENVDRVSRRTACPDKSYTATNSLKFDIVCNKDFPGFDIDQTTALDIDDCMEKCAYSYNGQCFMAVFEPDSGTCWLKNNEIDTDPSSGLPHNNRQAGIANTDQFEPFDTACPFKNNTIQASTNNGPSYKIDCGRDLPGNDLACDGCPWHTDTFQECLDLCQTAHPLCKAVSWNPDMINGFSNCYPKGDFVPSEVGLEDWTTHMGIAQLPNTHPDNCKDNTLQTAAGKKFRVSCNTDRPGSDSDILSVHDMDLDSCMNRCATYQSTNGTDCIGIAHDGQMINGWENCYLKGSVDPEVESDGFVAAFLDSLNLNSPEDPTSTTTISTVRPTSSSTSAPSSASSTSGTSGTGSTADQSKQSSTPVPTSSGSDAWIAGVVIGVLAFIALLVGAFFFWRRRQKKQAQQLISSPTGLAGGSGMAGSSSLNSFNAARPGQMPGHIPIVPANQPLVEKYDNTFYQPPPFGYAEVNGYSNLQPPPSAGPLSGNNLYDTKVYNPPIGPHPSELSVPPPTQPVEMLASPRGPTELAAGRPFSAQELDSNPRGI